MWLYSPWGHKDLDMIEQLSIHPYNTYIKREKEKNVICRCLCVPVHLTLGAHIFTGQFKSKLPNYSVALKENSRFTLCRRQKEFHELSTHWCSNKHSKSWLDSGLSIFSSRKKK